MRVVFLTHTRRRHSGTAMVPQNWIPSAGTRGRSDEARAHARCNHVTSLAMWAAGGVLD